MASVHDSGSASMTACDCQPDASRVSTPLQWAGVWVIAVALLGAVALWSVIAPEALAVILTEESLIEYATAPLYVVAALLVWSMPRRAIDKRTVVAVCILMLAFCAREMDLNRYWTTISMLKVSFYLGDAPPAQKLTALAVMLMVIAALLQVLRSGVAWISAALRRHDQCAITILLFVVTLFIASIFDRSPAILRETFDITLSPSLKVLLQAAEELLELALPLLVIVGSFQRRYTVKTIHDADTSVCERQPTGAPFRS